MKLLKYIFPFALVLLVLAVPVAVMAQGSGGSCPAIVQTALQAADQFCTGSGRNQACYGNVQIAAEAQPTVTNFVFDSAGDVVNVADVASMALSPMNVDTQEWGVAVLRLQANIPDTLPGQNVTFLMFGDVEIQNAVAAPSAPAEVTEDTDEPEPEVVTFDVAPGGGQNINVRATPSTNAALAGVLRTGQVAVADGRNAAGDWLRVTLPDGTGGWVFANLVTVSGDASTLAVVEGTTAPGRPVSTGGSLTLGQTSEGQISNAVYEIPYTFQGTAGMLINIRMERLSGDLDTYINLLGPDGTQIAFNDDSSELGTRGSILNGVNLPVDGTYTVVATRYRQQQGSSAGQFSLLVELDPNLSYSRPMQAFYFRTGIGDSQCAEAPNSGILVQTPQGISEVRLLVNGVRFELGSTAYLQAEAGGDMNIFVVEGGGRAESGGEAQFIPAGTFVTVPLDDNLEAAGPPSEPEPYDPTHLAALPVNILPERIEVAEPLAESQILRGDVRINLTWDTGADMDVWLIEPDGTTIFYGSPSSISGAQLDQDTNAACQRNFGRQENITWPTGQPRLGTHTVRVREWSACNEPPANWTLTVTIGDTVVLQESGTGDADFSFERR